MKKILSKILLSMVAVSAFATSGIMLRSKEPSLKTKTDKGYTWAKGIPYGTKLEVNSTTPEKGLYYWKGGSAKDVEFYSVQYQGEEYFVKADEFAIGNKFAVLSEDATLFNNARPSSFRNAVLEIGTLVLLTGRTEAFGSNNFTEIVFYDTEDTVLKTRWIQTKKYSSIEKDVKAAQLIELANFQTDASLKKEFISNALELASSSKIKEYAQKNYDRIYGIAKVVEEEEEKTSFTDDDIISIVNVGCIYTEDGSNVNVRSAPGTAGDRIAQLENGTSVTISLATIGKNTFEGITAPWYFVTTEDESISGWVFGGYVAVR